jgi:hypothetical protein
MPTLEYSADNGVLIEFLTRADIHRIELHDFAEDLVSEFEYQATAALLQ